MKNFTVEEKLKFEETADVVTYKVGEFYLHIIVEDKAFEYNIYDQDLDLVDCGDYENTNITLTEVIDKIAEDAIFVDMKSVRDRSAIMVKLIDILPENTSCENVEETLEDEEFER